MKPASPELLALLKTRQFFAADLYTFVLADGSTTLRYCAGDQDLTVNGFAYPAGKQTGPYFDRSDNKAKCHWKVGVEADTLVFDVLPGSATIEGTPFLQAVIEGVFDGAELTLDRVYMPTYGDTRRGAIRMFVGRVAEIDAGRSIATFSVNSHLELLNLQLPRNLYQPGCINNLGDAACQVDLAPLVRTGSAVAGSSTQFILTNSLPPAEIASGAFGLGTVVFTSGVLDGVSRTVKFVNPGTPQAMVLLSELPSAPTAGDTFNAFWGCDKSLGANGCPKFSNTARFRGFPFIPSPATAV